MTPTDLSAEGDGEPVFLFDMDGVLLEGRGTDEAVHDRALDDALTERGLDPEPRTRSLLAGHEFNADFVTGCDRLGIDPPAFYDLRERRSARRVIDRLASGTRALYGDVDAIEALAERHTLGIVSNNYDEVVQFVARHHGLDAFSHVRGRDTGVAGFSRRKPDPHYLLEAIDSLDGNGGFYVGDRATDVVAASRAGLDAVFVRRSHNEHLTLRSDTALEVDSLTSLASRL